MVVMFLWCVQEVAGLNRRTSQVRTLIYPQLAGSSSTLSQSQYTHVHSCDSVLLYTGIYDLARCLSPISSRAVLSTDHDGTPF